MRALISLLALVALPALAADFNDTGIIFCSDGGTNTPGCAVVAADGGSHPRQDARYGRDAAAIVGELPKIGGGQAGFDFTPLDALGQVTTPGSGATPHPCTRDNVSGRVWEVKTADGGLRDQKWTYTWYDSVHSYGGNPGTASGGICETTGHCDTEQYVADVNASALCGFTDWRMPSSLELQDILHFGRMSPAIDPTYFPNTPSSSFWSGSPYAYDPAKAWAAWAVSFNFGNVGYGFRSSNGHVRLVRNGQ
jgi:hypothetical protein